MTRSFRPLFTSLSFHSYLQEVEIPLRTGSYPPAAVQEILRFGAEVGSRMEHHHQLGRCRDRLVELIGEAERQGRVLPSGVVVRAEQLTASSGRFQRVWHAPPGGLWLSLALADTLLPAFARLLPFALGVSGCEAVRACGVAASLQWVNDLHCAGRKLAGMLCETVRSVDGELYHILGIGINGNNSIFPGELAGTAVSMAQVLGRPVDLEELACVLLAKLTWNIGLLHYQEKIDLQAGAPMDGPDLLTVWRGQSDTVGRRVLYGFDVENTPLYAALAVAVDEEGGLIMELADGNRITEYGGEIRYLDPLA